MARQSVAEHRLASRLRALSGVVAEAGPSLRARAARFAQDDSLARSREKVKKKAGSLGQRFEAVDAPLPSRTTYAHNRSAASMWRVASS